MKIFGFVLALGGFLLLAGAAGSQDFYDQCRAAADCVAGDPPSTLRIFAQTMIGLLGMVAGVGALLAPTDR